MIVYGIPNCNSVKKAIEWLRHHDLPFTFYDFKKQGINKKKLKEWCKQFGWENLLNTKGTTWQLLTEEEKLKINNEVTAIDLMVDKTSCIKRPIIEFGDSYLLRFSKEEYEKALIIQ